MNEELLSLLGATPEQIAQAQRRSGYEELGLLGQALSAAGAPAPRGTSTLGRLGQAAGMYTQAPRQTMDTLLQDLLRKQQIQDMQKKREQQLRSEAARQQFAQQFAPMTPQAALATPSAVGPTAARAGMIGQTPPLDRNQLLSQILNPDLPPDLREAAVEAFKVTAPTEPKTAPGIVGEFQAATASGLIPATTTLPEYIQMKKPPAPSATAIAGGPKDTFFEEVSKAQAKDFVALEKSGREAISKARDINRLDNLLSKIETGGPAAFKQAAGNFGINTKDLTEIQAAQAIINKLVPAQRPPGSGTMSDADLALYKESLPRIINQPGANKEIIRSMKEINDYLIEEGKIAAEVTARRITREEGTRRIFALGNPVQDFFDRTQSQAGISAGQPLPQSDLDLINRYMNRGR
jgi:hypothetical protein